MALAVEYAVQTRWTRIVSLIWLLPLTRLRATESGVDRRVFGVVTVASTLSPSLRRLCLLRRGLPLLSLASKVPGCLDVLLLRANQLSSPAQKRVISVVRAAMNFGFSWPRCRASHSSRMLCLKAARASASGQSTIWFFLVRNQVQNFLADSPGCWVM